MISNEITPPSSPHIANTKLYIYTTTLNFPDFSVAPFLPHPPLKENKSRKQKQSMLITETFDDVPTKADGNGSIRKFLIYNKDFSFLSLAFF